MILFLSFHWNWSNSASYCANRRQTTIFAFTTTAGNQFFLLFINCKQIYSYTRNICLNYIWTFIGKWSEINYFWGTHCVYDTVGVHTVYMTHSRLLTGWDKENRICPVISDHFFAPRALLSGSFRCRCSEANIAYMYIYVA